MTWDEIVTVLGADLAEYYRQTSAAHGPLTPEQRTVAVQVFTETDEGTRTAA